MSAVTPRIGSGAAAPVRQRLRARAMRLALLTAAGLVLAGIVHIVAVLLVPEFAGRDAAHAYRGLGQQGHAELLPQEAGGALAPLHEADRHVATAVCAYDLAAGPLRVAARTGTLPLAITLHGSGGGVLYAITDRAAIRGMLEFQILTEAQNDERLAQEEDGESNRELRVVVDRPLGLVVVRVLAKQASDRFDAEALATGVQCGVAG